MSDIIGYATLQVIPSFRNLGANISGAISGPLVAEGAAAGRSAGEAVATGLEAAQARVGVASSKLAKARDAEADAAGKLRVAEAQLQALRDKGVTDTGRIAAAEEKASKALRDSERASRSAASAADELADAEERASNATDEVAESGGRLAGALKGAWNGLDSGVKKMAAFAGAAAGVGGAVELAKTSMENGATYDKLAAQMGATGELAKEYGATAGRLYANGMGENMAAAADAVGLVASSFPVAGFEGERTLEQISNSALAFADIFDTDVGSAVQTASQLINDGLAVDSAQAFDMMTASFQRVPAAMREEIPELMQEYGTHLQSMGFNGEEAFGLLVNMAGKGKFALDKTGDSLKEFSLIATGGGEAVDEAFKSINLNSADMGKAIAVGGDAAQAAIQDTARGILGIEDPLKRAQTAITLFGTPLEDLSVAQIPSFLEGLSGAGDSMVGFEGSLDSATDTIYGGPLAAMQSFGRTMEMNVSNMLGDKVLPMLNQFTGVLDENEGSLLNAAIGATGLGGAFAVVGAAKDQVGGVFEAIGGAKDQVMEFKDSVTGALDTAKNTWSSAKDMVSSGWDHTKAAASWVKTTASAALNATKTAASWVGAQVKTAAGWAVSAAKATASFVVMSAKATAHAAVVTAAWLGAQAKTAAGWAMSAARATAAFLLMSAQATIHAALVTGAWVGAHLKTAAGWAVSAAGAVASFVVMSASATLNAGLVAGAWVASNTRAAASFLLTRGAMIAGAAATGIATAAQWAFNLALNANPIGLIIAGVAALVAGLVLFFTKTEIGQQIWSTVWGGIQATISFVWDSVIRPIFDNFMNGLRAIGDAAMWLWNEAIVPAFNGVKDAATTAISWVLEKVDGMVSFFSGLPGRISNAVSGLWDGLTSSFRDALNWLIGQWNGFRLGFDFTIPIINKRVEFQIDTPDIPLLAAGGRAGVKDGRLYGPGSGTSDSIMGVDRYSMMPTALVSAGEFVVNKRATDEHGPLLELINSGRFPRLAGGGLVSTEELIGFSMGVEGKPYEWGGVNWGDCSGAVSALANFATGADPFGSRFATGTQASELAKRGFQPGVGPAGSLSIGWFNGGPYGGHTAATLPNGVNFEMGGARGNGQYGGAAVGADDPRFTDHAHLPPDFFLGGDAGSPTVGSVGPNPFTGGGGPGSGGGGGGGGSFSGGSGGGSGMSWSGSAVAGGDAFPVFVVNHRDFGGGGAAAATTVGSSTPVYAGPAPAADAPLGGTGVDEPYTAPDVPVKLEEMRAAFVKSNADQLMSDLGLSGGSGALSKLGEWLAGDGGKLVQEHIHYHVADMQEAIRMETERRQRDSLAFTR